MRPLASIAAAALLALAAAGCGSDESGQETTAASLSIPSPTSPIAPGSTPDTVQAGKPEKDQETPATGGTPGGCSIPANYQDFKFTGVDCSTALAVANAWEASPNECNTIDDPNSPEGYNRTCSVEGYTCNAKRDVKSDGRFVTCSEGGASLRFTWFPN
jgi:hypothetical protein